VWARYDPRTIEVEPVAPLSQVDPAPFRDIPGVRKVEMGARGVELHVTERTAAQGVMSRAAGLLAARRIEIKRPSLEDIFIQLVDGESETLRDELKAGGGQRA
jgi:ABC-type uncharacterized transport system ATPase subunit